MWVWPLARVGPQSSHFYGTCWAHLAEGGGVKVPKLDGLFWAHLVAGHKPGEEVRGHGQVARVVAARPGAGRGGEGLGRGWVWGPVPEATLTSGTDFRPRAPQSLSEPVQLGVLWVLPDGGHGAWVSVSGSSG